MVPNGVNEVSSGNLTRVHGRGRTVDEPVWRGTCEISDCGVFPGAAEIALRSSRTGHVLMLRLIETELDAEGDVVAWHYAQELASGSRTTRTGVVEVTVWND